MSANLSFPGRAELAGYAGLAGSVFTGRSKPIAVIVAVDVLAVALAFGALQVTGAMMGRTHQEQQPALIAPVDKAAEVVAAATPVVPAIEVPRPRLAPDAQVALAATTDAAILFAPPVGMTGGFTSGSPGASSGSFTPPPASVASNPPPIAPSVVTPEPVVRTPPAATLATVVKHRTSKAAKRIDQVTDTVTDVADDSLDNLLLRDIPSAAAGLSTTVNGTASRIATASTGAKIDGGSNSGGTSVGVPATVTASAALVASTVSQTASNVTQPVSQVVSRITGILN